jgi:hypothetical protein
VKVRSMRNVLFDLVVNDQPGHKWNIKYAAV